MFWLIRSGPVDYNLLNLQVAAIDALTSSMSGNVNRNYLSKQRKVGNSDCNLHGYYINNECVCFPRFFGSYCELETPWAVFYDGSVISLTSLGAGRLLCVISDYAATTCLDDDRFDQSTFAVKSFNSSAVYIAVSTTTATRSARGDVSDTYLVSLGVGERIGARIISSGDLIGVPEALFNVNVYFDSNGLSSESVSFTSYYGGFLSVSTTDQLLVIDSSEMSTSSIYLANKAQSCE